MLSFLNDADGAKVSFLLLSIRHFGSVSRLNVSSISAERSVFKMPSEIKTKRVHVMKVRAYVDCNGIFFKFEIWSAWIRSCVGCGHLVRGHFEHGHPILSAVNCKFLRILDEYITLFRIPCASKWRSAYGRVFCKRDVPVHGRDVRQSIPVSSWIVPALGPV